METRTKEQACFIETQGFRTDAHSRDIYESIYGKEALELNHILHCIELEITKENITPHVLFQLIKSFFRTIKSKDPLRFHHDLARKVLNNEYKNKKLDSELTDLLAREICTNFNDIEIKLFSIPWTEEAKDFLNKVAQEQGAGESVLNIIEMDGPDANKDCFNKKGIFKPLAVYLKFLEATGKKGKELAKKIRTQKVETNSEFWFESKKKREGEYFFHSAAFLGFSRILWEDKVKERVLFYDKFPTCTVKPTVEILNSIISAKTDNTSSDSINLIKGTAIVGAIDIPLVPPALHDRVFRGIGKINTVVGHKTLRYAVSLPFEQKLNGVADFRVKEFDRGFVELGEEMGVTQKKQLTELREILYALKHLDIPNIKDSRITKGRLIDVTHFRSPKTGREDGLILTTLPTLVAYGEINCTGMLLIPIPTLSPPVQNIAAKQFHAALYHLQMVLLEEYSDKSKEFYRHKCIQITDGDWQRMLTKVNIPIKYKDRILGGWTIKNEGDAPRVLQLVDKDHYILGESYEKPSKFLMEQGKIRIEQSAKGKASAKKRKLKKGH